MDLGDFETTVKVIVVGNGGVGKSSMTARYCKGTFTDSYKKTIGVDFLEKTIDTGSGESVRLMIWDTAGQEEFDALTATYYRGAGACALVFSTTDRASFDAIEKWKKKVVDECGSQIIITLIQNKIDLIDNAVVTPNEVEELARKLNVKLYRTSVKQDLNIKDVFEYLAAQVIIQGNDTSGAVAAIGDYSSSSSKESNEEHEESKDNKDSIDNTKENTSNPVSSTGTSSSATSTTSSSSSSVPFTNSTENSNNNTVTNNNVSSSSSTATANSSSSTTTTTTTNNNNVPKDKIILPDAASVTIKLKAEPVKKKKSSAFSFC